MAIRARQGEFFDGLETMPPAEREGYQSRHLARAVARAYRKAPAVKKLLDGVGIRPGQIRTAKDLARLPITRKTELIEMQRQNPPYGGFVTVPFEEVERVFISPGPIYEVHSSKIQWFSRSFWAAGFRQGDVVVNTFTYHLSPAGILFHEGLRNCGATVVPTGTGNTDILIQAMRALGVNGFVGTPTFLMTVLKRIEELNLDFRRDFCLRRAWFTGEMLPPSLRKTFEGDYLIKTSQAYAVTEPGGAIAYECHRQNGMHLMDEYLTEIVDPQTGQPLGPGEVGEIVVTPLHGQSWGLIRFGTGDLSSYITEPCPCGRTAHRLTGIVGRASDAVKVRGMFIVAKQAEAAITGSGRVGRYQLIVGRRQHRDEMILRAEPKGEVPDKTKLADELNQRFQDACRVRIDRIEFVAPGSIPADKQGIVDERKWD